jgi:hypothetical protein
MASGDQGARDRLLQRVVPPSPHLALYVGDDVYHVLVDTYRWPHEDWIDWTVGTLLQQVFGRASPAHHG